MIVEIAEQAEAGADQIDLHLIGSGADGLVHFQDFDQSLLNDMDLEIRDQPAQEEETR